MRPAYCFRIVFVLILGLFLLDTSILYAACKYYCLKKGDSGNLVTMLQKLLVSEGFLNGNNVTGVFGEATRMAVVRYQKANGLTPDGIVGQKTTIDLREGQDNKQVRDSINKEFKDILDRKPTQSQSVPQQPRDSSGDTSNKSEAPSDSNVPETPRDFTSSGWKQFVEERTSGDFLKQEVQPSSLDTSPSNTSPVDSFAKKWGEVFGSKSSAAENSRSQGENGGGCSWYDVFCSSSSNGGSPEPLGEQNTDSGNPLATSQDVAREILSNPNGETANAFFDHLKSNYPTEPLGGKKYLDPIDIVESSIKNPNYKTQITEDELANLIDKSKFTPEQTSASSNPAENGGIVEKVDDLQVCEKKIKGKCESYQEVTRCVGGTQCETVYIKDGKVKVGDATVVKPGKDGETPVANSPLKDKIVVRIAKTKVYDFGRGLKENVEPSSQPPTKKDGSLDTGAPEKYVKGCTGGSC